jgi:prevent-host-death family protein
MESVVIKVTSVEAQNGFGRLIDTVQREPVTVTRHGRPAAFLVSPRDMEELLDARQRRSRTLSELEAWATAARASRTPDQTAAAAELTDEDVNRMVHESR